MKRLLALFFTGLLVLGLSAVSMATATFSGEIDVDAKGSNYCGNASSFDYTFGKMVLNGQLGDDLTGTLVYKADPVTSGLAVDEASVTFTEDWGKLKLGFYGWNNNLKDIVSTWTEDIKSQTNISASFNLTDTLNLGLDYAYTGSKYYESKKPWLSESWHNLYPEDIVGGYKNAYGADLGYVGDTFGGDLLYYHYSEACTAWGINAWMKIDNFKPFVQYRNLYNQYSDSPFEWKLVNTIVGVTYESPDTPFYARAEVELDSSTSLDYYLDGDFERSYNPKYDCTPWGIRMGYKLNDGAKVETQYRVTGFSNTYDSSYDPILSSEYSVKLICAF